MKFKNKRTVKIEGADNSLPDEVTHVEAFCMHGHICLVVSVAGFLLSMEVEVGETGRPEQLCLPGRCFQPAGCFHLKPTLLHLLESLTQLASVRAESLASTTSL